MIFLDFLFPRTCVGCGKRGIYFCTVCASSFWLVDQICPGCKRNSIAGVTHTGCLRAYGLDGLVSVFLYKKGIQKAIKRIKYRFVRDLGGALVEVSWERLGSWFEKFLKRESFTIVPVPLHKSRERWRGFNQASFLGEILASKLNLKCEDILARVKNTDSLSQLRVGLDKEEEQGLNKKYKSVTQRRVAKELLLSEKKRRARARQMRSAFRIRAKYKLCNSKLLIVDDVWTSGSTMLECAKVLKRAGANSVWGFTFARSGK